MVKGMINFEISSLVNNWYNAIANNSFTPYCHYICCFTPFLDYKVKDNCYGDVNVVIRTSSPNNALSLTNICKGMGYRLSNFCKSSYKRKLQICSGTNLGLLIYL